MELVTLRIVNLAASHQGRRESHDGHEVCTWPKEEKMAQRRYSKGEWLSR